jgi:protease-4
MELPESTQRAIQLNVENGYDRFLQIVAEARDMSTAEVDAVGQGRVWSANAALERGLVDSIGDLDDAIEAAANLAGIDQYRAVQITRPLSPTEVLIQSMAENFNIASWFKPVTSFLTPVNRLYQQISKDIEQLSLLNDPGNLYLQCFSCLNQL